MNATTKETLKVTEPGLPIRHIDEIRAVLEICTSEVSNMTLVYLLNACTHQRVQRIRKTTLKFERLIGAEMNAYSLVIDAATTELFTEEDISSIEIKCRPDLEYKKEVIIYFNH